MSGPTPSWEAMVTGIRWGEGEVGERWHLRAEWQQPTPSVAAIEVIGQLSPVVRMGSTVLLTSSWRGPVLDVAGMAATPWAPPKPGSPTRFRPPAGLDHRNADLPRRPFAQWRAVRVQVAGIERQSGRVRSPGLVLDLVGVGEASGARWQVVSEVPVHVRWFVEVGVEVTLHVDPFETHGDHRVDWAAFGTERSGGGWTWRDVAPPGCVATMLGSPR